MSNSNFCSCFVLNNSVDWKKSSADDWELDIVEISGEEKILGHKQLDDCICKIIQTCDGKIIAISKK